MKKLKDCYGGFIVVDEDTTHLQNLQWVTFFVTLDGRSTPRSLQVVVDLSCLWWEVPPWISQVITSNGSNGLEVRGELVRVLLLANSR